MSALGLVICMRKQNFPKISIVTPSYNQASFLEETITSVLDQNYPNLEYIIVDGGSRDNSVEIIQKYSKNLHFWVSEPDNGQYHAINKGFCHATGDIFAWLNSSDFYLPWTLRTVGSIFSGCSEVSWLTTLNKLVFSEDGSCINNRQVPGYSREAFLDGCYLPVWPRNLGWIQQESTFWRKDLWEKVGGVNEQYDFAADFDLWGQFFRYAHLYGAPCPLAGHRYHSEQRSQAENHYKDEAESILNKLRMQNALPELDRIFKVNEESTTIGILINNAVKFRKVRYVGGFLESLRELFIFCTRKRYEADVLCKYDDDCFVKWFIKNVKFSI